VVKDREETAKRGFFTVFRRPSEVFVRTTRSGAASPGP